MSTLQERLRAICKHDSFSVEGCEHCEAADRLDELEREVEALRKAANDAATSLETIGRLAGREAYLGQDGERIPTYMAHHDEVRAYAVARASAARYEINAARSKE